MSNASRQDVDVQDSHDSLPGYPAPSQSTQVFGHDEQAAFLARSYASGKMHHAFMFDGTPGIGKASLAFLFARHIIAHPDFKSAPDYFDPNVSEAAARQLALGVHPQVLHLTRPLDAKTGKHKTQLTVDETKKIGHFLSYTVAGNGHRVVIVDPVNDMNANAANALLKNLEEPTPRTLFILIAQTSGRLLPTIRSRCSQLRFHPLTDGAMQYVAEHLGVTERLGEGALQNLIARANGSPRIALMLADGGGLDVFNSVDALLAAPKFDAVTALKIGEVTQTREAEPLYLLLCDHILQTLADTAKHAAQSDGARAQSLSLLHREISGQLRQTGIYNLDKRQSLVMALHQMHRVL